MSTSKSKPKPKAKQDQNFIKRNVESIQDLIDKAKNVQLKRKQLIQTQSLKSINAQSNTMNHQVYCNQQKRNPLGEKLSGNTIVQPTVPLQMASIQSSFRPFQSNRTLQPYLINIKEEYICGSTSKQIQSMPKPSVVQTIQKPQINPQLPPSGTQSIQLSSSRQVSQEMLLHNSVTSKFLQSPTLSLGLVESKITKKQVDSQNNSKVFIKKKPLKQNYQQQCEQLLFLPNNNSSSDENYNKQSIRFYQELIKNFQNQHNLEQKKVQVKDFCLQFPENPILAYKSQAITQQTLIHLQTDPEFNNSIMTSYQMEVEYLRKINLYQSFQIQKLRTLIRNNEPQHARSASMNIKQTVQTIKQKHPQNKHPFPNPFYKKAIDILKPRQSLKTQYQSTEPLQQIHINPNNMPFKPNQNFICDKKRSVSISNHQITSNTVCFNQNNKNTINIIHPKNKHTKTKRKTISISDPHTSSYFTCQCETQPLNYKSQSLNISSQQMMNSSIGKHNISCSTFFMGTKTTTKKVHGKCKTAASQRNLSTIVSSSNKENHHVQKEVGKSQNKKVSKKNSTLSKNLETFAATKKNSENLSSLTKKKR